MTRRIVVELDDDIADWLDAPLDAYGEDIDGHRLKVARLIGACRTAAARAENLRRNEDVGGFGQMTGWGPQ